MYKYSAFFYDKPTSLLDYMPKVGLLILDEMGRIQESAQNLDSEEADLYQSLLEQKQITPNMAFSFEWEDVKAKMVQQRIHMSLFLRHIPGTQPQNIVNISSRAMQEFHGQMPLFKHELERWEKTDFSVLIVANNEKRAEKVQSVLRDYDMEVPIQHQYSLPIKQPIITCGNIQSGIELPMHKLAIVTENELFKKKQARIRKSQNISNAERIKNYQELKIGDYVVHRNHGIGKYIGVETLVVNKLHKDYML